MSKGNWGTVNAKARIQRNGSEPAKEGGYTLPAYALTKAQNGASEARIRRYLTEVDPGGERDVQAMAARRANKARDSWLRAVLDCCED